MRLIRTSRIVAFFYLLLRMVAHAFGVLFQSSVSMKMKDTEKKEEMNLMNEYVSIQAALWDQIVAQKRS